MKKQRMLAVLLCMMLVVTTLPMLAMAAPATDATFDTMKEVLTGYEVSVDYTPSAYWSMTEQIPQGTAGFMATPHEATIDPEKGTYINGAGSNAIFRFNNGIARWSPLATKQRFVYFKAQVSDTDKLEVFVQDATGQGKRGSFTISASAFAENAFGGAYYTCGFGAGTGMNEYLIFNDYDGIIKFFVKGANTGDKWVLAVNAYTFMGSDENSGLLFTGTGYVKDVTLYGPVETFEDIDTIAGEKLYNLQAYENTTETTTATGERYSASRQLSIEEGMVPVFRAKLDSEESSMRVVLRKPGETAANTTSYEFTVTPEAITANAELSYVNESFVPGVNYVDYALFATKDECKVYAREDNQFSGKWVHILTDVTASSADSSYNATPVIWADAGSFTVNNLKIYQPMKSYDSLDAIAGEKLYSLQAYENTTETTTATGQRYSSSRQLSIEEGMVPVFRAKLDSADSTMRVVLRKPGETAANTTSYEFTIAQESITSNAALEYVNTDFKAGLGYVDYALFATKTECKVYAKAEGQFEGKWVHILTDTTASSTDSSYNATPVIWAATGTFTVNNLKIYQALEIHDSLDAIAGEKLISMPEYEKNTETTTEEGQRYSSSRQLSIEEGMVPVFRAKLDSAESSMRVVLRKPGEAAANTTSYEFTIAQDSITSNAALAFVNGDFKAGLGYVDYALFATKTECKVYAKVEGQFEGKWVHILTDTTASSTDSSYNATPVIWAATGTFTVDNLKIYTAADVVEAAATKPADAEYLYFEDDFSGNRDYKANSSNCTVESGVAAIDASGYFEVAGVSIPVGGYAEFKVSGNAATKVSLSDSTSKAAFSVGGGDSYRIWRIVRGAEGNYSGYWHQEEDAENVWVKAFENEAPESIQDGKTKISIDASSDGAANLDYLKVYVPATTITELVGSEELTLVDGMGNNAMDIADDSADTAYKTMTALVKQGAEKKILLIAEYNESGALSKLTTQEVPAGEKVTSLIYDATEDSVKVFLWDGLDNITNLRDAVELTYTK